MRVLVCGGREFTDKETLFRVLDDWHLNYKNISLLIQGGSRGADWLAFEWANARRLPSVTVPAKWEEYGLAAGPIRNAVMVEEWLPDIVIAFPGGRGTDNMVKVAMAAGCRVERID